MRFRAFVLTLISHTPDIRNLSLEAAQTTLAGIETAQMIRKGQTLNTGKLAFEQFADLTV